jgi:two-component system cell cycle sensor histidine kinase/response regulator CckA
VEHLPGCPRSGSAPGYHLPGRTHVNFFGVPGAGSETILLVEDEEALRQLIQEILEVGGYRVLPGGGPEEALAAAEAHAGPIHLLLTDVVMPLMSGHQVADRIKASRPAVRIMYMSGYTDDAISHHGALEPGTHFLQKPFTADALLRKVREVLDA